jgi:hypothetical protein
MVRYEAYDARRFSQITLQVPLHNPRPVPDHEPAGGLSPIVTSNAARAKSSVRQIASVS